MRLEETCCHTNSGKILSANTHIKSSQGIIIIIIIIIIIMGLWRTDGSPNLGQKTRPYNNQQKKKRICKTVDIAVPTDHKIKLKECEKKDKYLDLAREF